VLSFAVMSRYTLLAKDQGTPAHDALGGTQTYGSYPYILVGDSTGRAHGVLLVNRSIPRTRYLHLHMLRSSPVPYPLSTQQSRVVRNLLTESRSNAMDVILTDVGAPTGCVTYRTTGGILDFIFFAGPSPLDVTRDLTATLGFPALPPYWGLGFHLCRWGYKDINETAAVVAAMRAAQLPHDVMWNDIDYMDQYLDFTSDPQRYPTLEMRALVDDLHAHGQHYVMITDPGISSTQPQGTYPPLDEGVAEDVFINVSGKPLVGKVWPGERAPDSRTPTRLNISICSSIRSLSH
jgi:alpha-glucosidase (family GH31 glycosyl hydrolase)